MKRFYNGIHSAFSISSSNLRLKKLKKKGKKKKNELAKLKDAEQGDGDGDGWEGASEQPIELFQGPQPSGTRITPSGGGGVKFLTWTMSVYQQATIRS